MSFRATRKIKQLDPLPPVNVNPAMEQVFQTVPQERCPTFSNQTIQVMDSADDLAFLVESMREYHLLDHTTIFLTECGMAFNNAKSHTGALFNPAGGRSSMRASPPTYEASQFERSAEKTPRFPSRLSFRPRDDATNHSPSPAY